MDMSTILHLLREPLFWLVSTCFSVVLSIIGNLLTPAVSDFIQQRSKHRSAQSRAKRMRLLGQVIVLFDNPEAIVQAKLDVLYAFVLAIFLLLVSIACLVASLVIQAAVGTNVSLVFAVLAVPITWLSIFVAAHGNRRIRIIRLAEKRKTTAFSFAYPRHLALDSPEVFSFYDDWDRQTFGCTTDEVRRDIESRRPPQTQAA